MRLISETALAQLRKAGYAWLQEHADHPEAVELWAALIETAECGREIAGQSE